MSEQRYKLILQAIIEGELDYPVSITLLTDKDFEGRARDTLGWTLLSMREAVLRELYQGKPQ